jgi:hypothetical protein
MTKIVKFIEVKDLKEANGVIKIGNKMIYIKTVLEDMGENK